LLVADGRDADAQLSRQFPVYVGVTWGGLFESAEGTSSKRTAHTFLEDGDTRPYVAVGCCYFALATGVEAPSRGVMSAVGEVIVNYFGDGISALPRVALIARVPARK
jgi:hypothetical protein